MAVAISAEMPDYWTQAQREFACDHPRTALRFKVAVNGARHYRRQCLGCGQVAEQVHKSTLAPRDISGATPFDEDMERRWREARSARCEQLRREGMDRERREWRAWYDSYLRSPEWRARRLKVLARAGGICEGCRERAATQVHHLTYERAGAELLFDLVAVCDPCHAAAHPEQEGRPGAP